MPFSISSGVLVCEVSSATHLSVCLLSGSPSASMASLYSCSTLTATVAFLAPSALRFSKGKVWTLQSRHQQR